MSIPWASLAAVAGGEQAGGPNLWPQINHLIWTVINFAILLWALNKFLYKPLLGTVAQREQEIKGNLDKAAEDRAEAERLRKEFADQVADAQRKAQAIVAEATRNAQAEAERIIADAREKAATDLERAANTIRVEKDRALAELREEVATLAVSVASKVIERSLTAEDHARLARKFVEEVGKN